MSKNKIVIGKSVLNEEAIKEFIERMKAHGYNVNTTEDGVEITGDTKLAEVKAECMKRSDTE